MAERANADSVAADIRPPQYRPAVKLMRVDIKKKKERISGINGEIGDIWGKIEGMKVPKAAGRIFMALDAMEDVERREILRCINGLIDAAEWNEPEADLADLASGDRVANRIGPNPEVDEALDDLDGGDGVQGDELEQLENETGRGRRPTAKQALESARARVGGGERTESAGDKLH